MAQTVAIELMALKKPATEEATRNLFIGVHYIGLKVPRNASCSYILWTSLMISIVTVYAPFGFLLGWTLKSESFQLSEFLTSFQVGINVFSLSFKSIIFIALQHRLHESVKFMRQLDDRCKEPHEIDEIRKVAKFGNRIFNIYQVCYFLYSTVTFLTQLASGVPPYSLYIPFLDWHSGRKRDFYMQALLEYVLMCFICYQDVLTDVYPVIYISILRAHLKILTMRVFRLGDNAAEQSPQQRMKELVECVKAHKTFKELFNIIHTVVSRTLFVQFVFAGTVMGMAYINMLIFAKMSTIAATSCFLLAVYLEVLPICYYGNCLLEETDGLGNAVFHCNWYDQDIAYKKMLVFFMQNVQKPVFFTAMKIFPITLVTLIQIMKFAFSVYTVMQQMDIGSKYKT